MLKFSHAESGWTEARLHHTINYFTEIKFLFFNRNFSLTVSILLDCWRLWLWNEYFSITDFSCSLLATFTSFDIRNYNSALSLLMAMLSHFFSTFSSTIIWVYIQWHHSEGKWWHCVVLQFHRTPSSTHNVDDFKRIKSKNCWTWRIS